MSALPVAKKCRLAHWDAWLDKASKCLTYFTTVHILRHATEVDTLW
jgi:hypothetical protein